LLKPLSASNAAASDVCNRCRRRVVCGLADTFRQSTRRDPHDKQEDRPTAAPPTRTRPIRKHAVIRPRSVISPRSVASQHLVGRRSLICRKKGFRQHGQNERLVVAVRLLCGVQKAPQMERRVPRLVAVCIGTGNGRLSRSRLCCSKSKVIPPDGTMSSSSKITFVTVAVDDSLL
jgi:hypothetical protein